MKKTQTMTIIAILSALSFVLMIPNFPIIPGVDFLKLDFSILPILLGLIPVSYTHLDVYKRQTPIPPIKWVKLRQKSSECDKTETSGKIVAPVVVKPELTSKKASIILGI